MSSKEALAIIEWVELYKYLGVVQFFIYTTPTLYLEPPVKKVFQYYMKQNIFTVTEMVPPSTRYHDAFGHYVVGSVKRVCQDDCLYTS